MFTVAVLAATVPTLFELRALTAAPVAGLTVTVIGVFNGRFAQLTTMATGLACCAASTASGVANPPVGAADTGTPPTLVTVNCAPCPAAGRMMNCEP